MAEVENDSRVVAERCGATVMEFADVLGKDPSLRCAAGYNLNSRGSRVVGEKLAEWLLERQAASAAAGALTH